MHGVCLHAKPSACMLSNALCVPTLLCTLLCTGNVFVFST